MRMKTWRKSLKVGKALLGHLRACMGQPATEDGQMKAKKKKEEKKEEMDSKNNERKEPEEHSFPVVYGAQMDGGGVLKDRPKWIPTKTRLLLLGTAVVVVSGTLIWGVYCGYSYRERWCRDMAQPDPKKEEAVAVMPSSEVPEEAAHKAVVLPGANVLEEFDEAMEGPLPLGGQDEEPREVVDDHAGVEPQVLEGHHDEEEVVADGQGDEEEIVAGPQPLVAADGRDEDDTKIPQVHGEADSQPTDINITSGGAVTEVPAPSIATSVTEGVEVEPSSPSTTSTESTVLTPSVTTSTSEGSVIPSTTSMTEASTTTSMIEGTSTEPASPPTPTTTTSIVMGTSTEPAPPPTPSTTASIVKGASTEPVSPPTPPTTTTIVKGTSTEPATPATSPATTSVFEGTSTEPASPPTHPPANVVDSELPTTTSMIEGTVNLSTTSMTEALSPEVPSAISIAASSQGTTKEGPTCHHFTHAIRAWPGLWTWFKGKRHALSAELGATVTVEYIREPREHEIVINVSSPNRSVAEAAQQHIKSLQCFHFKEHPVTMARVLGKGWCNVTRIMKENQVCISVSKASRGGGSQIVRVFGYGDGAVKAGAEIQGLIDECREPVSNDKLARGDSHGKPSAKPKAKKGKTRDRPTTTPRNNNNNNNRSNTNIHGRSQAPSPGHDAHPAGSNRSGGGGGGGGDGRSPSRDGPSSTWTMLSPAAPAPLNHRMPGRHCAPERRDGGGGRKDTGTR